MYECMDMYMYVYQYVLCGTCLDRPEGSGNGGGEVHVGPGDQQVAEGRRDEYGKH